MYSTKLGDFKIYETTTNSIVINSLTRSKTVDIFHTSKLLITRHLIIITDFVKQGE